LIYLQLNNIILCIMNNKREIVIDEEMTGLDLAGGARVVDIACIELIDGVPTGNVFQSYINPEGRPMSAGAIAMTGLTDEFLATQPFFSEIAQALQDFIGDSKIVVFCAVEKRSSPDQNFLNNEMKMAGLTPFPSEQWMNMRYWVQSMLRHEKGSLNYMLDKYSIEHEGRNDGDGHGALVDAELTAKLYPPLRADWRKYTGRDKPQTSTPSPHTYQSSIKLPSLTA
jgi:DNA polymerase-3 subunit epsilon